MQFSLRFDFRNPPMAGTSMADRYAAALDMVEWGEPLGCVSTGVSEHHGSDDGYLPSPVVMLAAIAARTTTMGFSLSALLAPFYDPIRLAEDLCVLDNLSRGRVELVIGAGYAREEFAMYGVGLEERPKRVTEMVRTLRAAFTGEPFEFRGRTVQITPPPYLPGGPRLVIGGSSEGAARRAARIGDGFVPTAADVWEHYRDEMVKVGKPDPGPSGPVTSASKLALATDPEKGWEAMAPYFLHETNAYGAWQSQDDLNSPYRTVSGIEELRTTGRYRVITPEAYVEELRTGPAAFAAFHPLCGGIPPEMAWESLHLFEHEVLPAFT